MRPSCTQVLLLSLTFFASSALCNLYKKITTVPGTVHFWPAQNLGKCADHIRPYTLEDLLPIKAGHLTRYRMAINQKSFKNFQSVSLGIGFHSVTGKLVNVGYDLPFDVAPVYNVEKTVITCKRIPVKGHGETLQGRVDVETISDMVTHFMATVNQKKTANGGPQGEVMHLGAISGEFEHVGTETPFKMFCCFFNKNVEVDDDAK